MHRHWPLLVLAARLGLGAPAPAAAASPCDAAGADSFAVAAVRSALEGACACDGFGSRGRYLRCALRTVRGEVAAGRLRRACVDRLRRIVHGSTCSFGTPRVACCEERGERLGCRVRPARGCASDRGTTRTACGGVRFCADARCGLGLLRRPTDGCAPALLYASEGNRLRRFDLDTIGRPPLREDVLIERASLDAARGRDVNGQVCLVPDGSGRFVAGEDTGQPATPPGWGVFAPDGTQVGKLAATYQTELPGATSNDEPFGCAFDAGGRLFTTDVGNQAGGAFNGQLVMWFPPFDRFPGPPGGYPATAARSTSFCKLATDIGTAGTVAVDELGRVYVASARGGAVLRFSPPFPTAPDAAGGCGATDALGSPLATTVARETFLGGAFTASGIARARSGNWYVARVFTGIITEHDPNGVPLREVLAPRADETTLPFSSGHPQGIAVDCAGDLYYADLALRVSPSGIGPGPNGTVRRIRFDVCGVPQAPEVVKDGLAFPDGLGVLPGDLEG